MKHVHGRLLRTVIYGCLTISLTFGSLFCTTLMFEASNRAAASSNKTATPRSLQQDGIVQKIMKQNKPVQVIHYKIAGRTAPTPPQFEILRTALPQATHGLYTPSRIDLREATYTTELECLDATNSAAVRDIQKSAEAYALPDALNIVAIDIVGCTNPDTLSTNLGYAPHNGYAVVNASGYEQFARAAVHEIGHMAGLGHADDDSIMSYASDETAVFNDEQLRLMRLRA